MPLMPPLLSAAAMLPPIHEPCPFQSVLTGPLNLAASCLSVGSGGLSSVHIEGLSSSVKSSTCATTGFSSAWVKSTPVSATATVTAGSPAEVFHPAGRPIRW